LYDVGVRPVSRVNMRGLLRRTLIPTLLLTCLQAFSQESAVVERQPIRTDIAIVRNTVLGEIAKAANALPAEPFGQDEITFTADPCVWLPTDIPHAEAVSGVCHFATSLPRTMPNFTCDEAASRYRGKNKVPFDLVTATVRYQNGNESYIDVKVNGQPKPEALTQGVGLWATGGFGSNLRSIFDLRNHPFFEFAREDKWGEHAAWVFTYTIVKQNDPLWRLNIGFDMFAPPYRGELWVDQKTGGLLRFGSVATYLPKDFAMAAAELQIDYANVAFADGSSFVLPADLTVTTTFRGEETTRNLVQFRSCHKFRAKTRMLLDVAAGNSTGKSSVDAASSGQSDAMKLEDDNKVYDILREQALREDSARLERETNEELAAATAETFRKVREREAQREKYISEQAANQRATADRKDDRQDLALSSLPKDETLTTLRVSVKLVPVSVVLRDSKGNVTGNLQKEDFQLFDNGKPQVITSFSVEKSGSSPAAGPSAAPAVVSSPTSTRDVAYVFDDIHSSFAELANARDAAVRHIAALRPEDHAALFTTSGQIGVSFTADRPRLQDALKGLRPHPLVPPSTCPPLTQYAANLVAQGDGDAIGIAVADTIQCAMGGMATTPLDREKAARIARDTAMEVSSAGDLELQSTINVLRDVVRRTAAAPGVRSIVLVSPGFLSQGPEVRQALMELVDQALRANIIIHTLDVKGLSTVGVSGNQGHPGAPGRLSLSSAEASAQNDVMAELAYGTGGTYFHNNNSADEGFRRTADAPDYMYVLGFSPQKLDGKFHKLKVTLSAEGKSGPGKLTVQARQGYYALKLGPGS
jgi:VWFA-related protein